MAEQLTWGELARRYPSDEAAEFLVGAQDAGASPEAAEADLLRKVMRARLRGGVPEERLAAAVGAPFEEVRRRAQNAGFLAEHGISPAEHAASMQPTVGEQAKEFATGQTDIFGRAYDPQKSAFGPAFGEGFKAASEGGAGPVGAALSGVGVNPVLQGALQTYRQGAEAAAVSAPRAVRDLTGLQAGPAYAEAVGRGLLPGLETDVPYEQEYQLPAGGADFLRSTAWKGIPVPAAAAPAVEGLAARTLGRLGKVGQAGAIAGELAVVGPTDITGAVADAGLQKGISNPIVQQALAPSPQPQQAFRPLNMDLRPRVIEQAPGGAFDVPGMARPGVVPATPFSETTSVLPLSEQAQVRVPREARAFLEGAPPLERPPPFGGADEVTKVGPPRPPFPGEEAVTTPEGLALLESARKSSGRKPENFINWMKKNTKAIAALPEKEQAVIYEAATRNMREVGVPPKGQRSTGAAGAIRGPEGEFLPEAPFHKRGTGDYPSGRALPEGAEPVQVWDEARGHFIDVEVPREQALTKVPGQEAGERYTRDLGNDTSRAEMLARDLDITPSLHVFNRRSGRMLRVEKRDGKFHVTTDYDSNVRAIPTVPITRSWQEPAATFGVYDTVEEAVHAALAGKARGFRDMTALNEPNTAGALTRRGTGERILPGRAEQRHQAAQERLTRQTEQAPLGARPSNYEQELARLELEINRENVKFGTLRDEVLLGAKGSTEKLNRLLQQLNESRLRSENLHTERARLEEADVPGAAGARMRALSDPLSQKAAQRGVEAEREIPDFDELIDKMTTRLGSGVAVDPADIGKAIKAATNRVSQLGRTLGLSHSEDISKLMNRYYGDRAMMFVNGREMAKSYVDLFGREEGLKLTEELIKTGQSVLRKQFIEDAMKLDPSLDKRAADELVSDLFEAHTTINRFLREATGVLKTTKVLYSIPTAYINNIIGNVPFALLGGGGMKTMMNGKALRELNAGGAVYKEALKHGLFGSEFFAQDTKAFLKALGDELGPKEGASMGEAMGRTYRRFNQRLAAGYDGIDKQFKLAAYMEARAKGMSPQDAVQHVYKYFPNYEKLARPFQALRKSAWGPLFMNPFMAFPLESMRIFKNVVKEHPARAAAALVGMAGIYNYGVTMGEFTGVGPTREEIKQGRRDMASYRNFGGRFTVPIARAEDGGVRFLDITNWIPLLDLVNGSAGKGGDTIFERTGNMVAGIARQTFLKGFLTSDYYVQPGQPGLAQAIGEAPEKLMRGEFQSALGDITRTVPGQMVTPPLIQRILAGGRAKRFEQEGNVGRDVLEAFSIRNYASGSEAEQRRRAAELEGTVRTLLIERARVAADVNISEATREARFKTIEARLERATKDAP